MKLSTFLTITAVVTFIFGLGFIVAPVQSVGLYGNTLDDVGAVMTRYFGSALIGLAFLAWYSRREPTKGVLVGFFVAVVLGLVVSLYDMFAGTGNALRWLNVLIYLLFSIGFGYFAFKK